EGWHPAFVNFPRQHPLYGGIGRAAHLAGYLKDADLVFLLAAVAPWHPPSSAPGPATRVVVLSDDPVRSDIPFWGYRSDLAVTGLPTALGIKAAHPERAVVALIGDGSFNYNPVTAAFGAAQEHRLPILIVLFNNSGYLSQKSGVPQHYPEGWAVKSQTFVGTS